MGIIRQFISKWLPNGWKYTPPDNVTVWRHTKRVHVCECGNGYILKDEVGYTHIKPHCRIHDGYQS